MRKRTWSPALLVMLLLSAFTLELAVSIPVVGSAPTRWTVNADGSANFTSIQEALDSGSVLDGDTVFVYSGRYRENIFMNKSISLIGEDPTTTIIDGNASEYPVPLHLFNITNALVENLTVQTTAALTETYGISLYKTINVTIRNVIVTDAWYGIMINNSTQCRIFDNKIRENYNSGIVFRGNSRHNLIVGNLISNNPTGIYIEPGSEYNVFYRNNLIGNTNRDFTVFPPHYTLWDNGAEGNYWDDYVGLDLDGDGIGDTNPPYESVREHPYQDVDKYPLIEPWNQTRTYTEGPYQIAVNCNYTVASFTFNNITSQTSFHITGPAGWRGFCNVTIPKELLNPEPPSENWIVLLGTGAVAFWNKSADHDAATLLSFAYTLGESMQENRVRIKTGVFYPPTADFEFTPDPASIIEPVNFTDTSTDGPNGMIVWRRWDFGDGHVDHNVTLVSHPFLTKALFNVTLTVGDNNSQTDSITQRVWVRNLQPSANFTHMPTEPSVGLVDFDASASDDPDGTIVDYRWNFDDGTVEYTTSPTVVHDFRHAGTYSVALTVVDDDGGEGTTTQTVPVGKGTTYVAVDAPDVVTVERTFTITATLRDSADRLLSNKQISFEIYDNDEVILTIGRTTNNLGVASASFSLNVRGEYTAKAEFQEGGDYFGSHNITTLVVNPIATNLTLEPVGETLLSEQLDLSARLLDQYENPIHEATVEFYLHNGSAWTLLGSSATDQNGVAALSYVPAVIGNFTLKAAFNGTAKHASSASHERVLTVVTPPTDYGSIIIPLVVIALAIALAFIVLKRRKPQ